MKKKQKKLDENKIKMIIVDQFAATFHNLSGCRGAGGGGSCSLAMIDVMMVVVVCVPSYLWLLFAAFVVAANEIHGHKWLWNRFFSSPTSFFLSISLCCIYVYIWGCRRNHTYRPKRWPNQIHYIYGVLFCIIKKQEIGKYCYTVGMPSAQLQLTSVGLEWF